MDEYIERKALRDALYDADAITMEGVKILNQFPAADAVEVVRCKDCTYSYEQFGFTYCTFGPYVDCAVPSQFYCAEGKRKRGARGVE